MTTVYPTDNEWGVPALRLDMQARVVLPVIDLGRMQRTEGVETPNPTRAMALESLARELRGNLPARVVIAGGPRCGKSVLSGKLGITPVFGSDKLIGLGWSEASLAASRWLDEPGPWVAEGVAMPRALRKWLARNPVGNPADLVVWLGQPVVARVAGQESMAAGCLTVWREIRPELFRRGVRIREV